jgi:hypothetical protein
MAIQTQGFGGVVDEVESATKARRTTGYPMDPGAAGAFSLSQDNGTTAMAAGLAAGSEIFQMRYTGTGVVILRSVRFSMGSVAAFVAGRLLVELLFARSWTVDGSGGLSATLTSPGGKKRTSFGAGIFGGAGAIRTAQTATLTAGTKTLDPHPLGSVATGAPTTVGPIVRATVPGTGTWYFNVQVEWAEKAAGVAYP